MPEWPNLDELANKNLLMAQKDYKIVYFNN